MVRATFPVMVCNITSNDKGDNIMSKGMDSKKTSKKEPAKTPKEKKAEKKIKKEEKKEGGNFSITK